MEKTAIAFLFLVLAGSLCALSEGDACTAPGTPDACSAASDGNPGFCVDLTRVEKQPQIVCNCLKNDDIADKSKRCLTSSDCCSGHVCAQGGWCISLAKYVDTLPYKMLEFNNECNPLDNVPEHPYGGNLPSNRLCVNKIPQNSHCRQAGGNDPTFGYCVYTGCDGGCRLQLGQECQYNYECNFTTFCSVSGNSGKGGCYNYYGNTHYPRKAGGETCRIAATDEACEAGYYCEPQPPNSGLAAGIGRCAEQKPTLDMSAPESEAYKSFCTDIRECRGWDVGNPFSGTICWQHGAIYHACINEPSVYPIYCRADSQCYSSKYGGKCTKYGMCEPFSPRAIGQSCQSNWECGSEKCDGGKCVYRKENELCGLNSQCESGMECKKNPGQRLGACSYYDAGSNPKIISIAKTAEGGGSSTLHIVAANLGRHATTDTFRIGMEYYNPDGSHRASISVPWSAPVPLQPHESAETDATVPCDAATSPGYYKLNAHISLDPKTMNLVNGYRDETYFKTVSCGNACEQKNGWERLAGIAMLATILFAALAYAIGYAANIQQLKAFAIDEIGAIGVSAIIVALIIFAKTDIEKNIFDFSCHYLEGYSAQGINSKCSQAGGADLVSLGMWVVEQNKDMMNSIMREAVNANTQLSREASRSGFCSIYGVGVSVAGCSAWNSGRGLISQTINAAGFGLMDLSSKQAILEITCRTALSLLLPLGIILRAFKFSRGAGTYLISFALCFYFIFPSSLVIGDGLVNRFLISDSAREDAHFGKALKDTTQDQISNYAIYDTIRAAKTWPDAGKIGWPTLDTLKCESRDPNRGAMIAMLDALNSPKLADMVLIHVVIRGLFCTLFALAITLSMMKALANALGTEVEVYHLARLS